MSLINRQIDDLRQYANDIHGDAILKGMLMQAADTIETLSEKARPTGWIPCSEKLPEEREWIGTKRFGTTISDEVYVTLENSKGERYTKHLCFQNGKLSPHDQQLVDSCFGGGIPIAWQPLPKPYTESEE